MIDLLLGLFIVAAAAQPAPSEIPGCVYATATITLSNLQTTALRCDINGKVVVQ